MSSKETSINSNATPAPETPDIELQAFVPYPQAIRWSLQSDYYETVGPDAWLKRDVPNMVTSNSFAAMQNALFVYDAVEAQLRQNSLSPEDPITVLEYGSGNGLFAYNFIRRFEQICQRDGKDYHTRLVYIATDYAESNIRALTQQPFLQKELQCGRLRLAQANALSAEPLRFLSTRNSSTKDSSTEDSQVHEEAIPLLSAVITNYLHCCLPVEFLCHHGKQWQEKLIRTSVTLTEEEATQGLTREALLQKPRIIKRFNEEIRWQSIELSTHCIDEAHQQAIEALTAERPKSTLLNPTGSLANIRLMQQHLRAYGIYLIHDKGHIDTTAYNFGGVHGRSTHGNSTAYLVNFPLLKAYAERLGLCTYQTRSRQLSLHTLMLEHSASPTHQRAFRYLYNDFNLNNDMVDLQLMSHTLEKHGELLKAAEMLQKCLRYRSLDVELHYTLGMYYLKLNMGQRALLCVRNGRPVDHFGQYNFDMIEGCAHKVLENFTLACKILDRALSHETDVHLMKAIEKELFDCHVARGLPTEDFTSANYPALDRLPATHTECDAKHSIHTMMCSSDEVDLGSEPRDAP